jgi:hypothetical protein
MIFGILEKSKSWFDLIWRLNAKVTMKFENRKE